MDCKVTSGRRCAWRRQLAALPGASAGFTLVETIIGVGLATMVIGAVVVLNLFSIQSFSCLGNYEDLDNQTRNTLDLVCRDIRGASAVTSMQTNLPSLSLTLTNANQGYTYTLTWNSNASTFVYSSTALGTETTLTGCDYWNFALFQRTPIITSSNFYFYPATNHNGALTLSMAKLVQMSWHCSRTILGKKINTESTQSAQIVLRN